MREIKFRGKVTRDGKWIYGDLAHIWDEENGNFISAQRELYATTLNQHLYVYNFEEKSSMKREGDMDTIFGYGMMIKKLLGIY